MSRRFMMMTEKQVKQQILEMIKKSIGEVRDEIQEDEPGFPVRIEYVESVFEEYCKEKGYTNQTVAEECDYFDEYEYVIYDGECEDGEKYLEFSIAFRCERLDEYGEDWEE